MPFIEEDDLIQTFLAHRSHPPFSERIRIRRLVWNVNNLDPFCFKYGVKRHWKLLVMIMNQIADRIFAFL